MFSDILLKYTLAISSTGFELNDATPIIFTDDSVVFQCKYARSVNANSQMTVSDSSETISGEGDLTYRMDIVAGALGGNTEITISPNHNRKENESYAHIKINLLTIYERGT